MNGTLQCMEYSAQGGCPDSAALLTVMRCMPLLFRYLRHRSRADGIGRLELDGPAALALRTLHRAGPLPAGDLARRLEVTAGNVTAMVDRLARDGYLRRTGDPADRRRSLIELTPAGQVAVQEMSARWRAAMRDAFSALSPEDMESLARILEQLTQQLPAPQGPVW